MSTAPHRAERAPPMPAAATRSLRAGRAVCRRLVSHPDRSSSPLRGCGRSIWTRSSPTAISYCREEGERPMTRLTAAPVFIESGPLRDT